jgi:hypothetical protein
MSDIRMTYRTGRVLVAIATNPGASNRQVMDGAGITDEGQASKLLKRLAGFGVIENTGSHAPGEANAWQLTARGVEVVRAMREEEAGSER